MLLSRFGKNFAKSAVRAAANNMRALSTTPTRQFFFRDPFNHPLSLYDPFRPMRSQRFPFPHRHWDPFAMMDHFFDEHLNFHVRDNAAKMSITEKGDLVYQVDTSGFHPEELKVSIEGEDVVIQGEHKEQTEGETVHRQFIRRFRVPEGIQKDTVKCEIDPKGRLTVSAKKEAIEDNAERKSIPIEMKSSGAEGAAETKPIDEK